MQVTTPVEAAQPLYRGVRGELPRAFWHVDKQGLITATDTAFMSCSKNEVSPPRRDCPLSTFDFP